MRIKLRDVFVIEKGDRIVGEEGVEARGGVGLFVSGQVRSGLLKLVLCDSV